ncbi:PREDICTED: vam6/Vps39-like protein isoform X2 [Nicrophorus vespilloides]|uniref:Vam6/Vps39-like protein isoform X2 n=1 Tax=Nicrophorus vespilloides TaxID=110193 RepID=A0ABM1MDN3_NICVS|nr:PREDICTED: vam6/Vps39-like protein isoform X2 [Nicrophorus vespilloides]
MHESYRATSLLKHNGQIECISSYNDNLLVGTRQGHLLMYNIVNTADDKLDIQLMRYNKTFSKKPILQLEVIPEYNILISLTDNIVQVHNISAFNFPIIEVLSKTKGATLFIVDVVQGVSTKSYNICIVVKRKLQLYFWDSMKQTFTKLHDDINLIEVPKTIGWCQGTVCVGYKGEYICYELNGKPKPLFPTSSNRTTDPCIVKYSETTFALLREDQTVLVNDQGDAEITKLIKWSDVPISIIWDKPYFLAVLADSIDVQTFDDGLIQTIGDLPKVRFICKSKQGLLYTASISQVWVLQAVDIPTQRKALLENKQFKLALKLTAIYDETKEEKTEIINHIQTLLAYDLFSKKRFRESMKEFIKLRTNPSDVIRLFPDLLPNQIENNESSFTEREWEDGIQALVEYLTDVRLQYHVQEQEKDKKAENKNANMNDQADKANQQFLQIIDTTLLKCYIRTNDALVAPLLRSNHCHLAEAEKTLKKYNKDNELIILYETKNQHRRALELLQSKGNVEKTVKYLQRLGTKHIGLILEFADWVLSGFPEEALKIFTDDLSEVENLPRPRVLDYLLRSHPNLVIPYLEYVVHTWADSNPLFHNALIHKYRETSMSSDPGARIAKKKLLEFLVTSKYYKPDVVLVHFPAESLLDERAIILGKIGQHEQVLVIYVRAMGDVDKAVNYCNTLYDNKVPGCENVYVSLIKLLLDPNSLTSDLSDVTLSPKTAQPDVDTALQLLETYAFRVNSLNCLNILPDNLPISRISRFLQIALHESIKERRRMQLLKGLLYAEHLQCRELRLRLESQSTLITNLNICPVCKKRFSNQSALVRYTNGDVVHYSCQDRKM